MNNSIYKRSSLQGLSSSSRAVQMTVTKSILHYCIATGILSPQRGLWHEDGWDVSSQNSKIKRTNVNASQAITHLHRHSFTTLVVLVRYSIRQ